MEDPRYPIGKYEPRPYDELLLKDWLQDIHDLPQLLEYAITNLDEAQLDTPYRDGGWTVKQLVHHVADSHMNAYIRCKLALTEEHPTIKPYFENRWAELKDGKQFPIMISLQLLTALHFRWVYLLRSLYETDFRKSFFHPESKRIILLEEVIGVYAWHGRHHTAHIKMCIK